MIIYYVLESDLIDEYTTDTKDGKQTHKHEKNDGGKEREKEKKEEEEEGGEKEEEKKEKKGNRREMKEEYPKSKFYSQTFWGLVFLLALPGYCSFICLSIN